jgi:hypothetical protein
MIIAACALYLQFIEEKKDRSWFVQECGLLVASSIALKNPAWRDEHEVRCQHLVELSASSTAWTLTDTGGLAAGKDVKGQPISFQSRNGTVVPFLDMPFEVSAENMPIEEIVLGPRCPNAYGNVWVLLGNSGYGKVPLRSAGGAYRG